MSGPETTFIASVHRHLPAGLYRMKNNNVFHAGIADVWYSGMGSDLWVEYKFIAMPTRDATVIDLVHGRTPWLSWIQQAWLTDRHSEGRSVGVIVGSKLGGVWMPGLDWQQPQTAGDFRLRLLDRKSLAATLLAAVTDFKKFRNKNHFEISNSVCKPNNAQKLVH